MALIMFAGLGLPIVADVAHAEKNLVLLCRVNCGRCRNTHGRAPARSHRFPTVIVSSLFQDSPRLTGVYLMIIDHKDWSTSAAIANNGKKAAGLITDRTAMWKDGAHDGRGFEKARITGGAAFAGHPARARYRRICDLILDGGIAPGQVVTIQILAKAFGVSTMPVREALKRLTAGGALSLLTGRSIGIPRLSSRTARGFASRTLVRRGTRHGMGRRSDRAERTCALAATVRSSQSSGQG